MRVDDQVWPHPSSRAEGHVLLWEDVPYHPLLAVTGGDLVPYHWDAGAPRPHLDGAIPVPAPALEDGVDRARLVVPVYGRPVPLHHGSGLVLLECHVRRAHALSNDDVTRVDSRSWRDDA